MATLPQNQITRKPADFAVFNASGPVPISEALRHALVRIGLRTIAANLTKGRYADADGIRRALGLSWPEVVGVDAERGVA